ncbi:MAG: hypothetical protein Q9198_011125 [Flavoplaca austrocitrina]
MFSYYVPVRFAEGYHHGFSSFSLKTFEVSEDEEDHFKKRVKMEDIPRDLEYFVNCDSIKNRLTDPDSDSKQQRTTATQARHVTRFAVIRIRRRLRLLNGKDWRTLIDNIIPPTQRQRRTSLIAKILICLVPNP